MVRNDRVALIERHRAGIHYFVIPGGGVEAGESIEEAALREAVEELGVPVTLGSLRVSILHREDQSDDFQQQYYFDATVNTDAIVLAGPELGNDPSRGTYAAVWLAIDDLGTVRALPQAVAELIRDHRGAWPAEVIQIDESRPSAES